MILKLIGLATILLDAWGMVWSHQQGENTLAVLFGLLLVVMVITMVADYARHR